MADIVWVVSSLALYRRYRPETFAEVIGQEHVTDPLQQALRNNRVNHAYLFSGPRGCGKTTSARILARCLNCEQGPTPTPCGECRSCTELARGGPGSIDVIEIDAASHGGVEDARELREKAFFGPAASRYKIYIVDEAHMVTSAGFNALLKVVEEPPEHLKFIFATTEPEKVIGTIRSRTHHYPFRLVPPGTLRDYLAQVCEQESIPVDSAVLPLVVRAGAGSVRDSMSVMDQLLAGAAADGVTYAMATALLGYTDSALLDAVVDAFAAGDGGAAFGVVDRVIEGGHDPRRFVTDLLERLRDLVILAAVPDAVDKGLIDAPHDVLESMRAQASRLGAAELSRAADLVNAGLAEMRGATSPRLQLELICARVLLPGAYGDERSMQSRLERLERGAMPAGQAAAPPAAAAAPAGPPAAAEPAPRQAPVAAPPAEPAPVEQPPAGAAPVERQAPPERQAPVEQPPVAEAPAAAAAPQGPRPGAWPTVGGAPAASPAALQEAAPRQEPAAQPPPRPASAPPPQQPPAPQPPAAMPGGGAAQVQPRWPEILDAVKRRRRFSWILLSQNARISAEDGATLRLGFATGGARDSFVNSGSEEVLRLALSDVLGAQWKVEAVVEGGGTPPPRPGGGGGGGGDFGGAPGGGFQQQQQPPPQAAAPPARQQQSGPSQPSQHAQQPPPASPSSAPSTSPAPPSAQSSPPGPAAGGHSAERRQSPPEPRRPAGPPVSLEEDIPAEDDADLDDQALSGPELVIEGLGATIIEQIGHD